MDVGSGRVMRWATRGRRVRSLWAVMLCGVSVCLALRADAQLPNDDRRVLAGLALRWAVDGGIADVKLLSDPSKLVVVDENLPKGTELVVPGRTVSLQSPIRIQAIADRWGDFLYFRIGPFEGEKDHATVRISLLWAVGRDSKTPQQSGGGAALRFERRDGVWTLLPVTELWAS